MNCVQCNKQLESALPGHLQDRNCGQPYAGGHIILKFCFGSTKFDNCPGLTRFEGFICDDCAEPLTKKMTMSMTDLNGEPWSEEIQEQRNIENADELLIILDGLKNRKRDSEN